MDDRERAAAGRRHDKPSVGRPAGAAPGGELARLAASVGNAAFARLVAPGGGILPGGTVHPSVERLIADRAGRGSRLDSGMARWASEQLDPAMPAVSVHADPTADALARSVSARAFTVRNDIFFAAGAYEPHTAAGRELVSHELTHVVQQKGAASGGPLRVSEPGDALERQAERVASGLDG